MKQEKHFIGGETPKTKNIEEELRDIRARRYAEMEALLKKAILSGNEESAEMIKKDIALLRIRERELLRQLKNPRKMDILEKEKAA